jgi:hypothetical protein
MMIESMMINFRELVGDRARNVSGHERGVEARAKYNLDSADSREAVVDVIIPDEIDAVASSFFQGMFAQSVRYYKSQENFLRHYRFTASPVVMEQILRGIDRSLTQRAGSAFMH